MRTEDFNYHLPTELIAQQPLTQRSASRLLHVDRQERNYTNRAFADIVNLLRDDDVLIMNDSRVLPARLLAAKPTGGKVEIMLERVLNGQQVLAQVRSNRSLKSGAEITLEDDTVVTVQGREGSFHKLHTSGQDWFELFHTLGHMPLPPYIERPDTVTDAERYQTVYAKHDGSVAAPTAGLHFDDSILRRIQAKGVSCYQVTLHVGAGTYQPVRVDDVSTHHMHAEYIEVSDEVANAINAAKANNQRIVAIGTTTVRALETAARSGKIAAFKGDSELFIYPGFKFNVVDALMTNFHLPKSTLLMLVSALADWELIRNAYAHAIEQQYRFFSYGDAMLIE